MGPSVLYCECFIEAVAGKGRPNRVSTHFWELMSPKPRTSSRSLKRRVGLLMPELRSALLTARTPDSKRFSRLLLPPLPDQEAYPDSTARATTAISTTSQAGNPPPSSRSGIGVGVSVAVGADVGVGVAEHPVKRMARSAAATISTSILA